MAEKREEEARAAAEAKKQRDLAAAQFVDNLDVSRPGGVTRRSTNILTREGIANAQRTSSPAIKAETALQDAMKSSSNVPPSEMIATLERLMAEATAAGVFAGGPVMKRAEQLLGVLKSSVQEAGAPPDPMADTMNAIFGDYVMPDELDD